MIVTEKDYDIIDSVGVGIFIWFLAILGGETDWKYSLSTSK